MMSQPNDRKQAEQATQAKGSEKSESSGSSSIDETYDFYTKFAIGIDSNNLGFVSECLSDWLMGNRYELCSLLEETAKDFLEDEDSDVAFYPLLYNDDPIKLQRIDFEKLPNYFKAVGTAAALVATRGTIFHKFMAKMSEEGRKLVHEVTSKLVISWNDRNNRILFTANLAMLLIPEVWCMSMQHDTEDINANIPSPFHCIAVSSLIPSEFHYLGECARLASFNIIFKVMGQKEKRQAMRHAINYVSSSMFSNYILETRRWNFWRKLKAMQTEDNWKVFVQQIEACCKEFATIRESMKMDLIPPVDIYEEFERGFATL